MKILHVLGDSKYGGAAKSLVRLAQLSKASGWETRILTTDASFQCAARAAGIDCVDLDCIWREIRPLKDFAGLFRLWRFLRAERVDIVHTHTTKAGFVGRIAAMLAGVPIIIHTVHGFAFHERSPCPKIAFYAVAEKIAAWCCHRIVTVSEFHRDWALQLRIASAEKLQAIPNGVPDMRETPPSSAPEIRASLGLSAGDIMLLTPGRLAPEKGLEDLLAAAASARGSLSRRLHVVLAGDGPLLSALKETARTLGLTDQISFLGFRKDIAALLSAADIVVLPSLREGLSIALLEAMSAGRAIIATSIGSNLEAAEAAALIVEPKDREALANAILRLSDDAALRAELGAVARLRWQQHYTMERAQRSYQETYQDLVRLQSSARPRQNTKRLIDILGSAVLLLLLAPLILACAAAVRLSSPGPILFRQRRLGLGGSAFLLMKFRTMHHNAPDVRNPDGSAFSSAADPRVTRVGRFLRKTSLDEFPQLTNILRGDMSLVGPRPDQVDQLRYYTPQEKRKLEAKPGLTGLAQISGRNAISWQQRKQLDVAYVERQSFFLDLAILWKTIPYVFERRNINANPD